MSPLKLRLYANASVLRVSTYTEPMNVAEPVSRIDKLPKRAVSLPISLEAKIVPSLAVFKIKAAVCPEAFATVSANSIFAPADIRMAAADNVNGSLMDTVPPTAFAVIELLETSV